MVYFKNWQIFTGIALIIIIIALITGLLVYFLHHDGSEDNNDPKGAVVTNGISCSKIAASILKKGGSAVDAAIAALFCEGVSLPHCLGLGGGFLMNIYDRNSGELIFLNSREVAPAAATENMFHGNTTLSTKGGLAVAVPAELRGYWVAYQKYGGKVPWRDLVQPTIDLCRNGIVVTEFLEEAAWENLDLLKQDPGLKEVFIDPATDEPYGVNKTIKRLKLAESLEIIAEEGGDALHDGTLTEQFAADIQNANGIVTANDLRNYHPKWQKPLKIDLPFNQVLYTAPLPGGGVILGFIMNLLNGFLDYSQPDSMVNWQRIVESFKFGFGKRTELGDINSPNMTALITQLTSLDYAIDTRNYIFDTSTSQDPTYYGAEFVQPDDHGTAHLSVLAPNGDAVSVTSTINTNFGAGFMSPSTGIILNDQMDDFSSPNMSNFYNMPPSINNYIKPGKRPLSSMCPSIILDENNEVLLLIGAAGGTKISTSVALVIIKNLWYNEDIGKAVAAKRLHHQLFPMEIQYEKTFYADPIVDYLQNIGHNFTFSEISGFTALTAISRKGGKLNAAYDTRRPGSFAFIV